MKLAIIFLAFYIPTVFAQSNQEILIEHFKAYNNADIEALANSLHANVSEYTYPNKLKYSNKQVLIKAWSNFIQSSSPKSKIKEQIEFGNTILTKEIVIFTDNGKSLEVEVVGIYEFKENLIHKLTFIE